MKMSGESSPIVTISGSAAGDVGGSGGGPSGRFQVSKAVSGSQGSLGRQATASAADRKLLIENEDGSPSHGYGAVPEIDAPQQDPGQK